MIGRRLLPVAVLALLAGCGIGPTGVLGGGPAPTGVAPGPALYYVDAQGRLRPTTAESGRLGTVEGAVDLLLRVGDPSDGALRSDLPSIRSLGPQVTVTDRSATVNLPLAPRELGPYGVDQVVCTVAGVRRQSGDPPDTTVVVTFTDGSRTEPRTCPTP